MSKSVGGGKKNFLPCFEVPFFLFLAFLVAAQELTSRPAEERRAKTKQR